MIEIAIKISDDEQTLRIKHLMDGHPTEIIRLDHEDPTLKDLVTSAISAFKGEPKDILLTIKMTW